MSISDSALDELRGYCDIVELFEHFQAVDVAKCGTMYECCCLFHSESTPSMKIYPDQGTYHCFGCGVNGDEFSLVQERLGVGFIDAVRWLSERTGFVPDGLLAIDGKQVERTAKAPVKPKPRVKIDGRKKWQSITPVPDKVPAPRLSNFNRWIHKLQRRIDPVCFWLYRDGTGKLLGADVRYEYEYDKDGETIRKKEIITWTWCRPLKDESKGVGWAAHRWDSIAPLYGLDRLAQNPTAPVILVEGCKAADAAHKIDGYIGVTWCGGSDASVDINANDWKALHGRDVIIWPDADQPGMKAAWYIVQHLQEIGAASVRVVEVSDLAKGWDLADA